MVFSVSAIAYPQNIVPYRIRADTIGTVTECQPPLVYNSVSEAMGATTQAKLRLIYQGSPDIRSSTGSRHAKDVIAIPMLPYTIFWFSCFLHFKYTDVPGGYLPEVLKSEKF